MALLGVELWIWISGKLNEWLGNKNDTAQWHKSLVEIIK